MKCGIPPSSIPQSHLDNRKAHTGCTLVILWSFVLSFWSLTKLPLCCFSHSFMVFKLGGKMQSLSTQCQYSQSLWRFMSPVTHLQAPQWTKSGNTDWFLKAHSSAYRKFTFQRVLEGGGEIKGNECPSEQFVAVVSQASTNKQTGWFVIEQFVLWLQ